MAERRTRPSLSWVDPNRWPVRWRLAAVSASLTMVILVGFAFVVGRFAVSRINGDFRDDLVGVASQLRLNIEVGRDPDEGVVARGADLDEMATAGDAVIKVVNADGHTLLYPYGEPAETPGAPDLGPPVSNAEITTRGQFDVVSLPIQTPTISGTQAYVQYARSRDSLEATIDRLWLFLGGGVLGGTILATLAGLAVAGRAMRPIAALTAAAREIAATRDPSRRLPMPQTDDEVAELARTLDQMLRELDAARAETEQMVQAQREFVADASHELRTPLTSILANLELLADRLAERADDPEGQEIVAGALGSSRRMRRLVSDLLLLARADAGRSGPRRPFDLAKAAATAIAEVRPVAEGHLLQIEADGPVPVEANPDDLHRMVLNLVENGVRHTPTGTRVLVSAQSRSGRAVLEVTDDGPGLPQGDSNDLFKRFVRGDGPADTAAEGGTGLGLAIVKAVATAHGGSVEAGSSAAGGARFTVYLPGTDGEQPRPKPAPDANKLAG